jgi:O-antigen/teichoic acid export membrane protein
MDKRTALLILTVIFLAAFIFGPNFADDGDHKVIIAVLGFFGAVISGICVLVEAFQEEAGGKEDDDDS